MGCTDECRKKHDKGPKKYPVCDLPFATNQYRASSEGTRKPTDEEKDGSLKMKGKRKPTHCVRVPIKRPKYEGVPGFAGSGCPRPPTKGKKMKNKTEAAKLMSGELGINGREVEYENQCTRCKEPVKEGEAEERTRSTGNRTGEQALW